MHNFSTFNKIDLFNNPKAHIFILLIMLAIWKTITGKHSGADREESRSYTGADVK